MVTLRDNLALLFNPLMLLGIVRFYSVLDPLIRPGASESTTSVLMRPDFQIPLACATFSLCVAHLAYKANHDYLASQPNTKVESWTGVLTYLSGACILFMYLFAVSFKTFKPWLASYASLCLVNAVWNHLAVAKNLRKPHVVTNLLLGIGCWLLVVLPWRLEAHVVWVYVLLAAILIIKLFQRRQPRFQPTNLAGASG